MGKTIVAIGEVLWDIFPDERRPGGAPCNVAYHSSQLGDHGAIITRVGMDADGEELISFLEQSGVDASGVQRDRDFPTGSVDVSLVGGEPHYRIVEDVAWDHLEATEAAASMIQDAHAVCFGSLVQRSADSRYALHELLRLAQGRALIVFDVNLRPPFVDARVLETSLKRADVVKMSASEVQVVSNLLETDDLIAWLINNAGVTSVCTTFGKDGAAITTASGTVSVPGRPVETDRGDFVGVGDAFVAALIHKLVRETETEVALRFANRYAALIATRRGAMPKVSSADLAAIAE